MSFWRFALSGNYKRFYKEIKTIAKKEKRGVIALLFSFIVCVMKHGFGMTDFLNYELWKKTPKERAEYMSIKDADKLWAQVNPEEYKTYFTVKYNFLNNFKDYVGRDFMMPEQNNFADFVAFVKKHPVFFIKPYDGSGGAGVQKIDSQDIDDLAAYHKYLIDNRLFVEEQVVQIAEMAALNSSCVNTIRVVTTNFGGQAKLLYANLRVGTRADVDNFHSGGMGASVNLETGKIEGIATDKDLQEYEYHPTTGVKFDGYQIPKWKEVCELCLKVSHVNTNIHVVGWDVAITDKGPILIEGNRRSGFDLPQVVLKKGTKYMMRQILADWQASKTNTQ